MRRSSGRVWPRRNDVSEAASQVWMIKVEFGPVLHQGGGATVWPGLANRCRSGPPLYPSAALSRRQRPGGGLPDNTARDDTHGGRWTPLWSAALDRDAPIGDTGVWRMSRWPVAAKRPWGSPWTGFASFCRPRARGPLRSSYAWRPRQRCCRSCSVPLSLSRAAGTWLDA